MSRVFVEGWRLDGCNLDHDATCPAASRPAIQRCPLFQTQKPIRVLTDGSEQQVRLENTNTSRPDRCLWRSTGGSALPSESQKATDMSDHGKVLCQMFNIYSRAFLVEGAKEKLITFWKGCTGIILEYYHISGVECSENLVDINCL